MPSSCSFVFDRRNSVYYSGETIRGRVALRTTSEKTVRGVYIIFEGAAKVHWEEQRSRTVDGKTEYYAEHFRGNQTYVNTEACVFGDGKLPPGIHEYTFNIPLPIECGTSCTQKYGKISYEITLKVDRPFRFDNVFTRPLTVLRQLDLNQNPQYLQPRKNEDVTFFCCWPCASGPVISTLTIPFGGWAPGQEIPYKLVIDNQSAGYDLKGTQLQLKQTFSFTARSPHPKTRTSNNTLARLDHEDRIVLRLSKRIFEGKLRVPPVPSTSRGRGIITVSYRIEMEIHTGDCHTDSEIWIPITIGTIPLVQTATNPDRIIAIAPSAPTNPDHRIAIAPTAPTPGSPNSLDKPPSYDICMPPTFEDATHIGEKFKDTDKDDYQNKSNGDWIPKYPMYTNFSVPTAASAPPADNNEISCVTESRSLLNSGSNTRSMPTNGSQNPYPSTSSNSQCPYPTGGEVGGMP